MEQDNVDLGLIGKYPQWNSGGSISTLINFYNGGLEEGNEKKRKHSIKCIKQRSTPINLVFGEEVKMHKVVQLVEVALVKVDGGCLENCARL